MTNPAEIIQGLHDSEINGGLTWLYDGAWHVWLGTDADSPEAAANVSSLREAAEWLRVKAVEHYPDSEFAEMYRS